MTGTKLVCPHGVDLMRDDIRSTVGPTSLTLTYSIRRCERCEAEHGISAYASLIAGEPVSVRT